MTLYEVYYHDAWRTKSTYGRQYIASDVHDLVQWLIENQEDWYDEETTIEDILEQALDQAFTYMTVKLIIVNEDGTVEWE